MPDDWKLAISYAAIVISVITLIIEFFNWLKMRKVNRRWKREQEEWEAEQELEWEEEEDPDQLELNLGLYLVPELEEEETDGTSDHGGPAERV